MAGRWAVLYWAVAGALVGFGLIGLMSIGGPFLLAGLVMSVVGAFVYRNNGVWALLVGFGGLPFVVLALNLLRDALRVDWSCSGFALGGGSASGSGSSGPGGETVVCATMPGEYLIMALVFLGFVLLGLLVRHVSSRRPAASAAP